MSTASTSRRRIAAALVVAVASSACGAGRVAEGVRQDVERGLFTEESTTTTTVALRVPEAVLVPASGLAACLDWSGSVAAPARLELRTVLALAVQSLADGLDPASANASAGSRPMLLNVRVVDDNAFGDSATTNVIASADVPGIHEVLVADPLAEGRSDLPPEHLLVLTDAHAAAQARREAESAARLAAVGDTASAINAFDRPPSNRTDNLGCLSAQAAWLRGRDVAARRVVMLGDLVNSGAQNLDQRLDGIEVLAVQVCKEAPACVAARDRFATLVAELGGTFVGAVRLDDPPLAADAILEGLR